MKGMILMNKYDEKQRDEVGVKDMENYEFGGVELDETLTNGAQVYIPYGIWVDTFKAMEAGSIAISRLNEQDRKTIKEYENSEDKASKHLVQVLQQQIKEREKHQYVLDKITPIVELV